CWKARSRRTATRSRPTPGQPTCSRRRPSARSPRPTAARRSRPTRATRSSRWEARRWRRPAATSRTTTCSPTSRSTSASRSKVSSRLAPDLTLRPSQPDDADFLLALYASTREEELAVVPWTDEQRDAFLRQQFTAQDMYWRGLRPNADWDVVEVD